VSIVSVHKEIPGILFFSGFSPVNWHQFSLTSARLMLASSGSITSARVRPPRATNCRLVSAYFFVSRFGLASG
jgi:hypothetical protein